MWLFWIFLSLGLLVSFYWSAIFDFLYFSLFRFCLPFSVLSFLFISCFFYIFAFGFFHIGIFHINNFPSSLNDYLLCNFILTISLCFSFFSSIVTLDLKFSCFHFLFIIYIFFFFNFLLYSKKKVLYYLPLLLYDQKIKRNIFWINFDIKFQFKMQHINCIEMQSHRTQPICNFGALLKCMMQHIHIGTWWSKQAKRASKAEKRMLANQKWVEIVKSIALISMRYRIWSVHYVGGILRCLLLSKFSLWSVLYRCTSSQFGEIKNCVMPTKGIDGDDGKKWRRK